MRILFVTHPEVVIDPAVPLPDWPLSPLGRERMEAFCGRPELASVGRIVCSDERKARDGAAIVGARLGLSVEADARLGENDRSATGYVAPPRFWEIVERFFAKPDVSVEGWERARDAQARIVGAVRDIASSASGHDDICLVSHGGVGTLLLCDLLNEPISMRRGQPVSGGGCFFVFDAARWALEEGWRDISA